MGHTWLSRWEGRGGFTCSAPTPGRLPSQTGDTTVTHTALPFHLTAALPPHPGTVLYAFTTGTSVWLHERDCKTANALTGSLSPGTGALSPSGALPPRGWKSSPAGICRFS